MRYPIFLKILLEELQKLPGIGEKTAERLAFHLLKASDEDVLSLSDAIGNIKRNLKICRYCSQVTDTEVCHVCSDPKRDPGIICVVEQPKDLWAIEKTGSYTGLYHVLMGRIAPLEGYSEKELHIATLLERIHKSFTGVMAANGSTENIIPVREVILAVSPTLDGDATLLYLLNRLKDFPITISRIARGISAGSSIEFANETILTDAIIDRKTVKKLK